MSFLRQPERHGDGTQPRAMQNLVGVGVADPAEQVRIGERALQRMVLRFQRRAERFRGGFERFESCRFGGRVQDMDLGAVLCARLGKRERTVIELEGREWCAPAIPMQSPGNHQMDRQPQPVVETHRDPLARAPHIGDRVSVESGHWRLHRTQQKRPANRDASQTVPRKPRSQGLYIKFDVRQFRHVRCFDRSPKSEPRP